MSGTLNEIGGMLLVGPGHKPTDFRHDSRAVISLGEEDLTELFGMTRLAIDRCLEDIFVNTTSQLQTVSHETGVRRYMDETLEHAHQVLRDLFEFVGNLVRNGRSTAARLCLETIGPVIVEELWGDSAKFPPFVRTTNLCCLVDCCEWGQDAISTEMIGKLMAILGKAFADVTNDETEDLLQLACFTVGALAETQTAAITAWVEQMLISLVRVIDRPNAKSEERAFATDNAISALGKVLVNCPLTPELAARFERAAWDRWIGGLPLTTDEQEAVLTREMLSRLLASNDPRLAHVDRARLTMLVGGDA